MDVDSLIIILGSIEPHRARGLYRKFIVKDFVNKASGGTSQ